MERKIKRADFWLSHPMDYAAFDEGLLFLRRREVLSL